MLKPMLIAALLSSAVCACNKPPAPATASSPPVIDLTCPPEPAALTDAQVIEDDSTYRANPALGHPHEDAFDLGQIIAGRACRDALHRVCEWHKQRGVVVDCDALPAPAPAL